jgi:hypothetical protein
MQWNFENEPETSEKSTKIGILNKKWQDIEKKFEWVKKFPLEEKSTRIFGAIFETLAEAENLEGHQETAVQTKTRILIEDLYQNAGISLGNQWASKPDAVSVVFDQQGHLVIDEILEMKTSVVALRHGLEKKQSQPQNSVLTIEKIVELINSMIESSDVTKVVAISKLQGKHEYQKNYLEKTYHRIKEMGLTENISFSSELQYRVILPANETVNIPKFEVTRDGKPIKINITNSQFSKKDIHNIIDHYQETP